MHEMSITQAMLDLALEHAKGDRITDIHLRVGNLSGIVPESVEFYFDYLSKGTPAEGAELVFRRVPARFSCRACGKEYEMAGQEPRSRYYGWVCPVCGELQPEVVGGKEFLVESIEVE